MSAEEDEGSLRGPDKSCSSDVDVPSKRPKVQDNSPDIEAGDSSEPSLELPPKEVIFCHFARTRSTTHPIIGIYLEA